MTWSPEAETSTRSLTNSAPLVVISHNQNHNTAIIMPPRLNIPPITRGALILLLAQSTLSAALRYQSWTSSSDVLVVPWLTLVPSLSLIYPWTFFGSTFVETNVFTLAASVLTLYHGGRYLERAWTSKEFAKFVLIVAMLSNIFTFATLYSLFVLTGNVMWT